MIRMLLCTTAIVSMMGGSAYAADLDRVDEVLGWGGFYAGGQVGLGRGDSNWEIDPFFGPFAPENLEPLGGFIGFHVGYNWQMENIVFGLEAEGNYAAIQESTLCFLGNASCELDMDFFGSVRGRVGGLVGDALLYGFGGVAYAHSSYKIDAFGAIDESTDGAVGWTAGGGIETKLGDTNWTIRGEYGYYDFGSHNFNAVNSIQVPGRDLLRTDLTMHTLRIAFSRKF